MPSSIDETLIDRIQEASFFPERWLPLLEELTTFAGYEKVVLFQADSKGLVRFVANEACAPSLEVYIREGWTKENDLTRRVMERRALHFVTTWDLFTSEEFEQTEYYKGFLSRFDMGSACGTVVPLPHGEVAALGMHRPYHKGPAKAATLKALNALRPDFARAILTSSRLSLEQARVALDILTSLRLPACALTLRGTLRLGNSLFEGLVPDLVEDRGHRLVFSSPEADKLFAHALERERAQSGKRAGFTFPVAAANGLPPYIAHLVPISGDSRDIFASAQWLLIAVPVALSETVNFSLIENLFDFTAAETAVAGGLLAGKTLNEIAEDRRASVQTVRSQLKAVMGKTGTNRQSDLVRLLSNTQVFGDKDKPAAETRA